MKVGKAKVISSCICVLTDRLVFNGGAGYAEIQFTVLLYAGVDQSLHGAFILEQQEGVACIKHSRVIGAAQTTKKLTVFLEFNVLITVIMIPYFCFVAGKNTRNTSNMVNKNRTPDVLK